MKGCEPERRRGLAVSALRVSLRSPADELARRLAFEGFGDGRDVLGRVAAAAAGDIDQPGASEFAQVARHVFGAQVEAGFRKGWANRRSVTEIATSAFSESSERNGYIRSGTREQLGPRPLARNCRRRRLPAGIRRALEPSVANGLCLPLRQRTAADSAEVGERRPAARRIRAYSPDHDCHCEWVYNRANIDAARVVWAREISPVEDQRLREYYPNRKSWVVIADATPPRLLAVDNAALAAYPRRPNPYRLEEASRGTQAVR